jgi:hypothetical protein
LLFIPQVTAWKKSPSLSMCRIFITPPQSYQRHFNYLHSDAGDRNRKVVAAFAYATKGWLLRRVSANPGISALSQPKPYIQRSDGSAKGDWDVGITLDVIDYAASR